MKKNIIRFLTRFTISALLALQLYLAGQGAESNVPEMEKLLKESINYKYGQNRQKLATIEDLISKATTPEERLKIEKVFSEALINPNSTIEFKEFVCRQLWYLGTSQSVSSISTLFTNENTVQWACYALVRNPSKEAEETLVNALNITTHDPKSQLAVINALGQKRAESAVRILAKFCNDKEPQISEAAIRALGQIGNEEASKILTQLVDSPNMQLKKELLEPALIECALRLANNGKKFIALQIYNKLFKSSSVAPIRRASLIGIVENSVPENVSIIISVLKSKNTNLYPTAIYAINVLKDPISLQSIIKSIPDFSPTILPDVINILSERKPKNLLPVVKNMISDSNQRTRLACIKAIGTIGDSSSVQTLVKLISQNIQPEKDLAVESLKKLPDEKCNNEILKYLKSSDYSTTIELINIVLERNIKDAVNELLQICQTAKDEKLQSVAFKAIAQLGEPSNIKEILSIITSSKDIIALREAESAAIELASKIEAKNNRSKPILDEWKNARSENAQTSLLRILGGIADSQSLQFLGKIALSENQSKLQDVAIRELADWQDTSAIPILETIYQSNPNEIYKSLAFKGYIRLLSSMDLDPVNLSETVKCFERASRYAKNPEEKKLILSGLPTAPDIKTLAIALEMLNDNSVKLEAANAVLQISLSISGAYPEEAIDAIKRVISFVDNESLKNQANITLKQINELFKYITVWEVNGPYFKEGYNYDVLFNVAFPPEQDPAKVNWKIARAGTDPKQPYIIDLLNIFDGEQRVAYARTFIYSPTDQEARLELGSDDGIKAWLNSKLVHENNVARPITPNSDKVNLMLQKGWNSLMLKITQNNLGWAFSARLVKPDGTTLENVKYSTKPD